MRKYKILILFISLFFISNFNAFALGNEQRFIDGYWYLYDSYGNKLKGFQEIPEQNKVCYYDENGKMVYGQKQIDGYWYNFDRGTGARSIGFTYLDDDKKTVYYNEEGKMLYGKQVLNGKTYYFHPGSGATYNGLVLTKEVSAYFNKDGSIKTGTREENINGYWYLFGEDGIALKGFQNVIGKNKVCYYDENGKMVYGQKQIDGYWYNFDKASGARSSGFTYLSDEKKIVYYNEEGKMLYGKQIIKGKTYYLHPGSGSIYRGFVSNDNIIAYFNKDGSIKTGAREENINGYWYLFGEDGIALKGFQNVIGKNKVCYYDENGKMVYGEKQIDGYWYLFDKASGSILKGFQSVYGKDKVCYYDENGRMLYGKQVINNREYYFDLKSGALAKGLISTTDLIASFNEDGTIKKGRRQEKLNGHWYLFGEDGFALKGFQEIPEQNKICYYDDMGRMVYGQKQINGNWYYFNKSSGARVSGFQFIEEENKTCYYDENGKMVYGKKDIDGLLYDFDLQSGAMKNNFFKMGGQTYYSLPDGTRANNWIRIAGEKYFFNSLGEMIGKNVKKIIDVSAHQGVIDWNRVKNEGDIDGVILRISAGVEREDSKLSYNISEVKRLGIPYGIYIYSYAENYDEGTLYAQFTVDRIKKYNMNPTLGIFLDIEGDKYNDTVSTPTYEKIVEAYFKVMEKNGYLHLTSIYTGKHYAETRLNTKYLQSKIKWIAQYNHRCYYKGSYIMWQYSEKGKIPGIKGNVDMNVLFDKSR